MQRFTRGEKTQVFSPALSLHVALKTPKDTQEILMLKFAKNIFSPAFSLGTLHASGGLNSKFLSQASVVVPQPGDSVK